MDNQENRKIFSGNLSSFLNESSKSFDVIIDRTQPLPDGNISVLINQVKFLTPLLVYIIIRATRWDHSQSSRIEKTSIFQFF